MANYHQVKNAAILTPTSGTDLGSSSKKYGNLFLDGNITLGTTVVNSNNVIIPKIASISYVGDDTATSIAGGQTVTLTGTGFSSGAVVVVSSSPSPSTTVVSNTQITFVAPAMSAGTYVLYVINSDGGTATFLTGISYSGTPTWTTSAGSLGSLGVNSSVNISVAATGDAPVTYAVKAGSSLPSGLSLNTSTGAITGTTPTPGSSTTYTFTLTATDAQNQDTDRSFSITVLTSVDTVEYLVVGGGGGGGRDGGGGGGAGGYRTATGYTVTSGTPITVTVGSGGAGHVYGSINPTNGGNSVFGSITSLGGGYGAGQYGHATVGGSGGGGANDDLGGAAFAQGTAGQGNAGGTGNQNNGGGGGGGAGQAGYSYSSGSSTRGRGGDGLSSSISGTSTYYAGGGGGGMRPAETVSNTGGLGGGGNGVYNATPSTAGTVNTGGGGGGGSPVGGNGSAGGSGIVIIRYSDAYPAAASTTGSPTITVAGGYRVYKFTASGSITF